MNHNELTQMIASLCWWHRASVNNLAQHLK